MLIKAKTIKGYSLNSLDGVIGSVSEFYFDDRFLDCSLPCCKYRKLANWQEGTFIALLA